MKGGAGLSGILEHIRHAEGWLRQARGDCARGDARQVVLRLLLAEAEIRRARESSPPAGTPASFGGREDAARTGVRMSRRPAVWAAAAAAGLLMIAASMLMRSFESTPRAGMPGVGRAAADEGRGILRFESGRILPLVGFPAGMRTGPDISPNGFWGADASPGGEASPDTSLDVPLRFGDDGSVPAISR